MDLDCDFIKEKFYKVVYLDNKELEIDYEDGQDYENELTEEEKNKYKDQIEKLEQEEQTQGRTLRLNSRV